MKAKFLFLCLLLLAPFTAQNIGGCFFLASVSLSTLPAVLSAGINCTNNANHDPTGQWARGYWDREITWCEYDNITIQLRGCATNGNNEVLRLHAFHPTMGHTYKYFSTGNQSYKTRFELHMYCGQQYADMFAANWVEWWCNPE